LDGLAACAKQELLMSPKVSICIPTYNRKDYLKETLDSVFAQTYRDYEVVVLDDGSTDGTEEMIKTADYKVRYYWQQNRGDAAARNKLLELAQGKFITFLDSDDLLMPDAVERMMKVMEAEGGDIVVYGPYLRIDQNGNVYGRCKRKLHSGHITKYLFQNILVHSCGSMFPQKAIEEAGGFDETLPVCSDYDLWLRLSLKYRFIALQEPTFRRRRHLGNLSRLGADNQIRELGVLERFYYEKDGHKVVPKKIAANRFGKEEYRVGIHALQEGNLTTAREYLIKSFKHHPNLKSLAVWSLAIIKQKCRPQI
jgi:glycosyltransferase involved in cell wall biosynthesis